MSYYAFFKGWLLLSQPPGCLGLLTSFPTELYLGTLAGGLGCFPLDNGRYHPLSVCHAVLAGIRSLQWFGNPVWTPSHNSALPPVVIHDALPK